MHHHEALLNTACHSLLDLSDDIAFQVDARGNLTYLNRAGHAALDLPSGAAYGKPWMAFVHEDDRARVQKELSELAAEGRELAEFDGRLFGLHGAVTPVNCRVRSQDGGYVGVARNMQEQRRLEEQLHQSQKLETIGMLAGGIAHDFNNMLAAILGYTELMLEDKEPDDPDYRALTHIQTSTERAAALAKQLLLFSRRSGADLRPIRASAVVDETLQILQRTLPKTIRVVADLSEPNDRVMADRNRLEQAVMNLCVNARDAMPAGGELRLEVEHVVLGAGAIHDGEAPGPGEFVRLRVQDTGTGMPPDVLHRIWEPFFTTKPTGEGTGLGLSVVGGIMRAHRGHVQVESQVGRGTTFYLYLPAAVGAEADQVPALAEPPGGTETILVVDDEPVLLGLLNDILSGKGYSVLAAGSGAEALEYVQAVGDRIHLIISDNMMPGMSGRQLAQEVLRLQPGMRILVCSGFSPTRESELSEMDYVASYVQKPYQRRELLTRVREVLDRPVPAGA